MGAGEYRERWRVEEATPTENRFGVAPPTWSRVATIYAKTIDAQGSEPYSTAHDPATTRRRLKIRARAGLNTAQRIILNDVYWYDIEAVLPIGSSNREMIIECVYRGMIASVNGSIVLVAAASTFAAAGGQTFSGVSTLRMSAGVHAGVGNLTFSGAATLQLGAAAHASVGSVNLLPAALAYWAESQIPTTTYPTHLDELSGGHDMRLGSTGGTYLSKGGFARFVNGVANNHISTPDSAFLAASGVITVDARAAVALTSWTPTSTNWIASKFTSGSGGWQFVVTNTGALRFTWTDGATGNTSQDSSAVVGVADGSLLLIRAVAAFAAITANTTCTFYTKTSSPSTAYADTLDDSGWTQLGVVRTGGRAFANDATAFWVGRSSSSANIDGKAYAVVVKIAGSTALAVDFTDLSTFNASRSTVTGKAHAAVFTVNNTGADSADPTCAQYQGVSTVFFPGAGGNFCAVTPSGGDVFKNMTSGTLDLRCRVQHDSFRPSTTASIMASGGSRLQLSLTSGGAVQAGIAQLTSGTIIQATSTAVIPNVAASLWLRWAYDFATGNVTFFTAPSVADHTLAVWTQLGVPVALALSGGTTSSAIIPVGFGQLGSSGSSLPYTGHIYDAVWMKNGVVVLNTTTTDLTKFSADRTTLTAVTGETVTLTYLASGKKMFVVTRNGCVFGTDDYEEMYDCPAGLAYPLTLAAVIRVTGTPTGAVVALCNTTTASNHLRIRLNAGVPEIVRRNASLGADVTVASSGGALSQNLSHRIVARLVSATLAYLYVDDVLVATDTTQVDMPTIDTVMVGAMKNGTVPSNFLDFVKHAALVAQRDVVDAPLLGQQLSAA